MQLRVDGIPCGKVYELLPKYYRTPVADLDFNSLYPCIMSRRHNMEKSRKRFLHQSGIPSNRRNWRSKYIDYTHSRYYQCFAERNNLVFGILQCWLLLNESKKNLFYFAIVPPPNINEQTHFVYREIQDTLRINQSSHDFF